MSGIFTVTDFKFWGIWLGSVIVPNLPRRVFVCLLKAVTRLPSLPSEWSTDKYRGFLGMSVIFTVVDFKFWRICLVNILVRMVLLCLVSWFSANPKVSHKRVFTHRLTAREREQWFLLHIAIFGCGFSGDPEKFYVQKFYMPFLLPTFAGLGRFGNICRILGQSVEKQTWTGPSGITGLTPSRINTVWPEIFIFDVLNFFLELFRHYITFSLPQKCFGWSNFALHDIILSPTLNVQLFCLHYIILNISDANSFCETLRQGYIKNCFQRVLQGAAQRGGAILLHVCACPDPFSMQPNEPFPS